MKLDRQLLLRIGRMMMKKGVQCITLLLALMVVGGCASSTRNEPNMSRDGVGVSNNGDGAEVYGSIRVGVSGRL